MDDNVYNKKLVIRNTVFLTISTVFARIVSALCGIIIARYLEADLFGVFSTAISFATIFALINDLGLGQFLLREGSRDENRIKKYLTSIFSIKMIFAVFLYATMIVIAYAVGYSYLVILLIFYLGAHFLLIGFRDLTFNIFQALQKMHITALVNMSYFALILAAVLIVILKKLSVVAITQSYLIVSLVVFSFCIWLVRKYLKLKDSEFQVFNIVKESLPFGLGIVFFYVYVNIDITLLSIFRSNAEVGFYAAAVKIILLLYFLPMALRDSISPILFKTGIVDVTKHKKVAEKLVSYLTTFGIPVSVFLYFFADSMILTIYGDKYAGSIGVFHITAWILALQCISLPLEDTLVTKDYLKWKVLAQGIALVANVVLNIIFIPKYGIFASAYIRLFTEILYITFYQILLWRVARYGFMMREIFPNLFASMILAGEIMLLKNLNLQLHSLWILVISMITYPFIYYLVARRNFKEIVEICRAMISIRKKSM